MALDPEPADFVDGEKLTPNRLNQIKRYMVGLKRQIESLGRHTPTLPTLRPVWFLLGDPVDEDVAGQYDITLYNGDPNYDEQSDISGDDLGSEGPAAIAWNLWEMTNGPTGKSVLQGGDNYLGIAVGPDNTGKTLVLFSQGIETLVLVALTQTGGSDGSKTTLPTYTYQATFPGDSTPTDDLTPTKPYPTDKGAYIPATLGWAYFTGGAWMLLEAFAVLRTGC